MAKFWEMFEKNMIVQGMITGVVVLTVCYLMATGQEVPALLQSSLMLVLGFYFGSKVQYMINSVRKSGIKEKDALGALKEYFDNADQLTKDQFDAWHEHLPGE